jgi:hypothetical protein
MKQRGNFQFILFKISESFLVSLLFLNIAYDLFSETFEYFMFFYWYHCKTLYCIKCSPVKMFLHPVNVCVQYNPKLLIPIYMLFVVVRHKVHSLAQSFCNKCIFPTYAYCSAIEFFRVCYMKNQFETQLIVSYLALNLQTVS